MASFGYRRVYSLFEWFWRKFLFLWGYICPVLSPIVRYTRKVITWRKSSRELQDEDPERPADRDCETGDGSGEFGPGYTETEPGELPSCQEDDEEDDDKDNEKYQVETTDEYYCCYDSTWETDEHTTQTPRRRPTSRHYNFTRFENAARDMHNYRHGYPVKPPCLRNCPYDEMPNLKFYCGQQPSEPDGIYINTFHTDWLGRYDKLEYVHSYIQWLFPLQEPGMNPEAHTLTKREIQAFLQSDTAKKNLLKSYKLMLDFYGIRLENEETGAVRKAPNWVERFQNLNMKTHNNLRITRILKCLGTLGYQHYQAPLVRFFLEETLVHQTLPSVRNSALNYFLFAVLDKKQRRKLVKFAYCNYDFKGDFVWCPRKLQRLWSQVAITKY